MAKTCRYAPYFVAAVTSTKNSHSSRYLLAHPRLLHTRFCAQVKMSSMTRADEDITVSGQGMPRKAGGRGNLIVHLKTRFPRLSAEQKSTIRQALGPGRFNNAAA